MLAADGAESELSLFVENLPRPRVGQLGFQCVIAIEGAKMRKGAQVTNSPEVHWQTNGTTTNVNQRIQRVLCEPTIYHYESSNGTYEAQVTLVWNRNHVVDWRPLTIYKCGVLGSHRGHPDCSLCLTRPPRYQCSWCGSACQYSPQCPTSGVGGEQAQPLMHTALDDQDSNHSPSLSQCPSPRIDVVSLLFNDFSILVLVFKFWQKLTTTYNQHHKLTYLLLLGFIS